MTVEQATIDCVRAGLLASADVARAYELAQSISDDVNEQLNELAERRELTVATSLLARAITARALLIVAGDWWQSLSPCPAAAFFADALRSFVDEAPPGYVDRSGIDV